jgi:hypothetical protein
MMIRSKTMVESTPKFYSSGDGHASVIWPNNQPKTTPEEMMSESSQWDVIVLIGAAGMVVAFFVAVFWLATIVEYLLK